MARPGARPKAAHLRLIDGTHRTARHGDKADAAEKAESVIRAFGKLTKPRDLKGEAAKAWNRFIAPADWLDGSREPAAIMFCELWAEFRRAPASFQSGKHGTLRALMSELGLTDERNRGGNDQKDERDEFFDR